MARKSKGFRELLKQKQGKPIDQQRSLDKFEQRFKKGSLGSHFSRIVKSPKSEVKMSEVLEYFVEPYLEDTDSFEHQDMLFNLAVIAWNMAIMPDEQRQPKIDELITQVMKIDDPLVEQETRELISDLMDRKLEHFPDVHRYIVDFQLEDAGDQYHLSVASSPSTPSKD